jgi:hypothetical protein
MSGRTLVIAVAIASLGAVELFSTPASAYDGGGYCYYHPHDAVCLAGVVAPLHHHGEYDHYHDHHH